MKKGGVNRGSLYLGALFFFFFFFSVLAACYMTTFIILYCSRQRERRVTRANKLRLGDIILPSPGRKINAHVGSLWNWFIIYPMIAFFHLFFFRFAIFAQVFVVIIILDNIMYLWTFFSLDFFFSLICEIFMHFFTDHELIVTNFFIFMLGERVFQSTLIIKCTKCKQQ